MPPKSSEGGRESLTVPPHCREVPCLAEQMIHNLVGLLPTHPEVLGLPLAVEGDQSGLHPDVLQM